MSLRPQVKTPEAFPSRYTALRRGLRRSRELHLTPRESEVLHWVSEGKRDREIAVILGLSPRTVEKHVCHILEKLQVETRTAAANQCHELLDRALADSKIEVKPLSTKQAREQSKTQRQI